MRILFFILLPGLLVTLVEAIGRRKENGSLTAWLIAALLLMLLPAAFPRSLVFARVATSVLLVAAWAQILWRRRRQ
jgi:hypothetical protein